MNGLISALGLVLGALLKLPATSLAVQESKKSDIAKSLSHLVLLLEEIIQRGYEILLVLDRLPDTRPDLFDENVDELVVLLDRQIEALDDFSGYMRKNIFLDRLGFGGGYDRRDLLRGATDVKKVLSVYEPDLGVRLDRVIEYKTSILSGIIEKFREDVRMREDPYFLRSNDPIIVKELVEIDSLVFSTQFEPF